VKIFNLGLDIEPGKYKHKDSCFDKLVEKFSPQKATAYTVEFFNEGIEKADAVVFSKEKKLDLVLIDLDKIEKRILKADEGEKKILLKAQKILEEEKLLCDAELTDQERSVIRDLQPATLKPAVERDRVDDIFTLVKELFAKAGVILFFTVGKKEVRVWSLEEGASVLEAAGKIHSDLKRGFIKADVISCKDIDNFFNMAEARSRGFVEVVDKDYIVKSGDIIEIRFNV